MKYFVTFIFLFFSVINSFNLKKSINFNQNSNSAKVITYLQLQNWAYFNQLEVQEDKDLYGLQDNLCHIIPSEGLDFYLLDNRKPKNVYLYLDMAVFQNRDNQKRRKARFLNIYVNDSLKKVVYFTSKTKFQTPIEIEILAQEKPNGKIDIRLESDKSGSPFLWCIWDSYFLYQKEKIL